MFSLFLYDADRLQDSTVFAQALARMSLARQTKVQAYRFANDQRLSLAAGVLLDDWLHTLGHSLQTLPLAENAYGKPYFPDLPQWYFSLSHAGHYAVLAVANSPIGVDIEQIHDINPCIADRYFTTAEQCQISQSSDPTAQFFHIWTCKEAYVKAVGLGLQMGLQSFSVDLAGGCLIDASVPYHFFQPHPPTGYAVAVCIKG